MINLTLSRYRRARVWLSELPGLCPQVTTVVQHALQGTRPIISETRRAALELYVPSGPRILYGLLGAEFSPETSTQLAVQVAVTGDDGELVESPLAARYDDVRAGLPQEYTQGVIDGVRQASPGQILGSGVLRFGCAAHGRVGSSQDLFRRLAVIIVPLLTLDADTVTEKDLVELLESRLTLSQKGDSEA